MPFVDLTGSAAGSGTVTGSSSVTRFLGSSIVGSSSLTGDTIRSFIFSGFTSGAGSLTDGLTVDLEGSIGGSGSASGSLSRVIDMAGSTLGSGRVDLSVLEPIFGIGTLAGYLDIEHVPPPACGVCKCAKSVFSWLQPFQKGDLEICVQDIRGNPIAPFSVTYTLFWIQKGCVPHQVGCANRTPVPSSFGHYYVTGVAGEGGQPGLWMVRWSFQESFGGPVQEVDMCFQVQDAIAAGDASLPRVCKYGWD